MLTGYCCPRAKARTTIMTIVRTTSTSASRNITTTTKTETMRGMTVIIVNITTRTCLMQIWKRSSTVLRKWASTARENKWRSRTSVESLLALAKLNKSWRRRILKMRARRGDAKGRKAATRRRVER